MVVYFQHQSCWCHSDVIDRRCWFIFYSSHATFLTYQRGVYEISVRSIYWGPTDQWPTTDWLSHLANIGEISNGHISARGRPIHFMFGSTVGFLGSANRMASFPVWENSIGMRENNARGVIRLVTIQSISCYVIKTNLRVVNRHLVWVKFTGG